jgi:SAM-dependent methyltransferase
MARQVIFKFVEICAEIFEFGEPIYEFGASQVPGQEHVANLRPLFPNKTYVGVDVAPGIGVDMVMELPNIDNIPEPVGSVICLETLEHVRKPKESVDEMYRILKPGGILIISAPMWFPIHNYPHDYWRFTPEGFGVLMDKFRLLHIDWCGDLEMPHTVVGIGIKGEIINADAKLITLSKRLEEWKQEYRDRIFDV